MCIDDHYQTQHITHTDDPYHFHGTSDDPTHDVGVEKVRVVLRQLHKVCEWVLVQDEGELVPLGIPVGHGRHYTKEALEANLDRYTKPMNCHSTWWAHAHGHLRVTSLLLVYMFFF